MLVFLMFWGYSISMSKELDTMKLAHIYQGGKWMMAGGAEKCGCNSGCVRSGGSGGMFLAILVFQLVLITIVISKLILLLFSHLL